MAFAAVLPAQLGDVEGAHLPQRRGEAEAGVVNIEGGELGQQKAQQGLLLVAAVAGFRLRGLAQIQRDVAIAQDQLTKYRLEFVEGAPEVEVAHTLPSRRAKRPEFGAITSCCSSRAGPRRVQSSPMRSTLASSLLSASRVLSSACRC